jgi:chemotaxis protein methyltransferase WspC
LVRLVQEECLPAQATGPVRLLSIPSSSGEEPYSMAMALLEAGVKAERFHIDAIDLSARALAKAREGVYGRNSFRGKDLAFRERWFQPVKEGYLLAPVVRQCVGFSQANLLSAEYRANGSQYDFIFCRNLLIYFDRLMQAKALDKLQPLLSPGGVMFVGAAEQPLVLDHGFVSANLPMAFAFRRAGTTAGPSRPARPARALRLPAQAAGPKSASPVSRYGSGPKTIPLTPALSQGEREKAGPAHSEGRPATPPPVSATAPVPSDLERARRLADAGQLEAAAAVCETHLKQSRGSAPGWYLLGLVREASGDPAAMDCYRKALYLEPDHYESLLQMASLTEKNGDATRARTYRRRAQRRQNSSP